MTIKRLLVASQAGAVIELATFELVGDVVVCRWRDEGDSLRAVLEDGIITAVGVVPFSRPREWFDALELAFANSTYVGIVRDP